MEKRPTLPSAVGRFGNMEKSKAKAERMAASASSSLQVASIQGEIRRVDWGFPGTFIKAS
jgi:hypothetical protein